MGEFRFGTFTVCERERVVRRGGVPISLAPKAIDVLLALLNRAGTVVDKRELIDSVWPESYVDEGNLTQTIYVLRAFLREHRCNAVIENVPKRGYRLVVNDPSLAAAAVRDSSMGRWAPYMLAIAIVVGIAVAFRFEATPRRALDAPALANVILAKHYEEGGNPENLQRSNLLFAQIARDYPQSAIGFAGMAQTATSLTYYQETPAKAAILAGRAIAAANEAVAKDSRSSDAWAALGGVEMSIEHDDNSASKAFGRSLALDPDNVDALAWQGTILLHRGNVERAQRLFARTVAIAPDAAGTLSSLAWSDFLLRDYGDAVAFSKQMLLEHQLVPIARATLANAYIATGDFARAQPFIEALARGESTRILASTLGVRVAALTGHHSSAVQRLRTLAATTDPRRVDDWDATSMAAAYLAVHDTGGAFVWLARISPLERRQIAQDSRFASLRGNPRFSQWVRD